MAHNVIMPQMGESIAEGTITTWLKKVGDTVERDEALFEISTDKVDAEIPSPVAGVLLEIKVEPGATVPIDTIVAVIGEAGESTAAGDVSPAPEAKSESKTDSVPSQAAAAAPIAASAAASSGTTAEERRRTKSSPLVRKIASEHGIDITTLSGSGLSGRVTKADIMAVVNSGGAVAARPAAAPSSSGASMPGMGEIPAAYRPQVFEGDTVEPLTKMREKIAEHMVFSRRISSHVQTVFEVDFSHVDKLRRKHKPAWLERHGTNLTFTSFVMKATVDALSAFPVLNASLDGNTVIYHKAINLGLAVALDWGLLVPVIRNAEDLNVLGLSKRLIDLGTRAKNKKLKPDELQQGTFTITNPGVFGNLFGLPVINQPQVGILGMGGVEKRPVVITHDGVDSIAIRTMGYLSLSFDHRLVDGAVADQFMSRIKKGIQEFDEAQLG